MPKRKKGSTTSLRPRFDLQERLLGRFYEPLVLLYTLGRTRGEPAKPLIPSRKHLSYMPLTNLRRIFLNELAYMCDYDKGGRTVTAIGLQCTPEKQIVWVATNSGSTTKVIEFLASLLKQVMRTAMRAETGSFDTELASHCIHFATPRVKKYGSHLRPLIRRCVSHLLKTEPVVESGFIEWLQSWEYTRSPVDLCSSAYTSRKSNHMQVLARLGAEPSYGSNEDSIHSAFAMVRHYIGRLGHHFRAAGTLIACAPRLLDLFHNCEVRGVPVLPHATMPPPDQLTRPNNVVVRMLPANAPQLDHYQQALAVLDTRFQVFHRFQENMATPSGNPCIHAEILVLEHFYRFGMRFVDDDSYIACSKPACFCCLLYFRHHPAHVIEPISHNKIYLNWRPPDFSTPMGNIGPHHQRDILNTMNQVLRKEILLQLDAKTGHQAQHPDSVTGITISTQNGQAELHTEGALFATRSADDNPGLDHFNQTSPGSIQDESREVQPNSIELDAPNGEFFKFDDGLESPSSDSDEDGGVQLPV